MEYVFPQLFSPDDVDIRLQYISVSQLEKMIETGKLCIPETEELQRMSNAWNDKERSSFIESVMANLPIQLIYLDGSKTPWTVIDGVQRISSLHKFLQNEFVLEGLEYFSKECEGMSFSSIPFYLRSRIESTNIVAYVINPGTPDAVKFNIFKRINKIGKQRNREELRNAFFQGSVSKCIAELAESHEFLQATHKMMSKKGCPTGNLYADISPSGFFGHSLIPQKPWTISWIKGWMLFPHCLKMILRGRQPGLKL